MIIRFLQIIVVLASTIIYIIILIPSIIVWVLTGYNAVSKTLDNAENIYQYLENKKNE